MAVSVWITIEWQNNSVALSTVEWKKVTNYNRNWIDW